MDTSQSWGDSVVLLFFSFLCIYIVIGQNLLIFRSNYWCGAQTVNLLKTVIGENKVAIWFISLNSICKRQVFFYYHFECYSFLVTDEIEVKCCDNTQYIKGKG